MSVVRPKLRPLNKPPVKQLILKNENSQKVSNSNPPASQEKKTLQRNTPNFNVKKLTNNRPRPHRPNKCCTEFQFINHLPVTINKSGVYKLCRDLETDKTVAVKILASDVHLDLNSHSITVTSANATAVVVGNFPDELGKITSQQNGEEVVANVEISNGSLLNTGVPTLTEDEDDVAENGRAINTYGVEKLQIYDLYISGFLNSIVVGVDPVSLEPTAPGLRSKNIDIQDTYIESGDTVLDVVVSVLPVIKTTSVDFLTFLVFNQVDGVNVENVQLDADFAAWGLAGIALTDANLVHFSNFKSRNADIFYRQGNNAIFEKLEILIDDTAYVFNNFQLGGANHVEFVTNDVILKDSTFLSYAEGTNTAGLGGGVAAFAKNNNVLIQGNIFESRIVNTERTADSSTVSIGADGTQACYIPVDVKNIKFINNLVLGNADYLLFVASSPAVTLPYFIPGDDNTCANCVPEDPDNPENCVYPATVTTGIVIKDNTFTGHATDTINIIYFDKVTDSVIKENHITAYKDDPNQAVVADGITLVDSDFNSILENTITSTETGISLDSDSDQNVLKENILINNTTDINPPAPAPLSGNVYLANTIA